MFRVLLAPTDSPATNPDFFKKLRYPLLGSPKLDGIRSVIKNGVAMSRTFKPLPSCQVQEMFSDAEHADGELIDGSEMDGDVYNRTQSKVMSTDKKGDLTFHLFDYTHPAWLNKPFFERHELLKEYFTMRSFGKVTDHLRVVDQVNIENYDELLAYEDTQLALGFEGIMMRDPLAGYKNGRSTLNQGVLIKLKRFEDSEGMVVAYMPTMHNTNEQVRDERGYAKRSEAKAGLVAMPQVGKFIVGWQGQTLEIAPGMFTHEERNQIWLNQDKYLGKLLKFRYFAHGIKDKPRFPRAIGWRDKIDL